MLTASTLKAPQKGRKILVGEFDLTIGYEFTAVSGAHLDLEVHQNRLMKQSGR